QPSLGYRLHGTVAPTVEWLGESPWSAEQLGVGRPPAPKADEACAFLAEFLKDGPRTSADVRAAARRQGIAPRPLTRAAKPPKVRPRRLWRDQVLHCYWLLPGQSIPTGASRDGVPDEFDRLLADIEKQRSAAPGETP